MQIFLNLLALFWPFYQFSEIPIFFPVRLYGLDLISFICLVIVFFRPRNHPLLKPLILFLSSLLFSLLVVPFNFPSLRYETWFQSSLYLIRLIFYASLIFANKNSKPYLHLSFFFVPISGLIQYFLLPDLRFLTSIGYDDHYYRLTFPFFDPGFTATVLVFIIFISLEHINSLSYKILTTLSLFALALTFSRSGYLSFFLCLMFFIIRSHGLRKHLKTLTFSTLFLILIILASPKPFGEGVNLTRTYSLFSRLENNRFGLDLFLNYPLTGVGFNTLRFINESNTLSRSSAGIANSFIFIAVTAGIPGLLTLLYFLKKTLTFTSKNIHFQTAIISLLINSLTNNSLFYAPILILFFFSLASFTDKT